MRWIDFEGKKPTDTDLPGWKPWTQEKWAKWLADSAEYTAKIQSLNDDVQSLENAGKTEEAAKKLKERNKHIDDHADHWGKLKPWLLFLSHDKCWFTEGKEICSHYDVEHFRPKKEALGREEADTRDGYWWLSFDYENFRLAGGVPNKKKGGFFPLLEGTQRSTFAVRCEESEVPYLLDPISSVDADLLAFNEEGNAIPTPGCSDWDQQRVHESIKRYKLNDHDQLPAARREVWQNVTRAADAFLKAKARYDPKTNPAPYQTMKEKARYIRKLTRPDVQLSSVARWCLLFRNDPLLNKLVGS